jgi:hypothetical protein
MSYKEFRFRKNDRIGAAAAEDDLEFLKCCFVDTGDLDIIKNIDDNRQIVLGRTGSGKSALLAVLQEEKKDRAIPISPDNLALTYVSNSNVIRHFASLGVNLDPFFKLLWRHILIVEILRVHFDQKIKSSKTTLWDFLSNLFSGNRKEDKELRSALAYLKNWGESFWLETEYRVREITKKLEDKLTQELKAGLKVPAASAKTAFGMLSQLSEEQKIDVVNRAQQIVSTTQVKDLSRVIPLLDTLLNDRQKQYYILIDRLDENWVEEKLRYKLIMALLDSLKEISRVRNAKVIIAIRRDLMDRVFRLTRDSGFQEEKYQSLYLPLTWSKKQLIEVLDRRINVLVRNRYTKKTASHKDLLPKRIGGVSITNFITERTSRPRDVISFFNKCIEAGEHQPKVNVDKLRRAEGEYSRSRLRALADEWHADYPGLLDFTRILNKRPASFKIGKATYNDIADLCLRVAIEFPGQTGLLRAQSRQVVEGVLEVNEFKIVLFRIFYRIGLIGLKLETFEKPSWADEIGQGVSRAEIDDETSVVVHPAYRRALGIQQKSGRGYL